MPKKTRLRFYAFLFVALSVIYHSNLRPFPAGDTLPASLIPFAILLDHTVHLDRFGPWLDAHPQYAYTLVRVRGHYYSSYPIAGPLLATPLYLPIAAFSGLKNWEPASLITLARIVEKFAAVTLTALSAIAVLLLIERLTNWYWAWRLTLVYALATVAWSTSSQALWQHTFGQIAIIGALFFLERWAQQRDFQRALWYCGACTAAALMIRHSNAVLLVALVAALFSARARTAEYWRFAVLPLAGGLAMLAYNLRVFQNVSGHHSLDWLDGSLWGGLTGILFSPGRGLLIYTPVALFALCALLPKSAVARRKHLAVCVASAAFVLLDCLVVAKFRAWWGGYCWGPRLLAEIMPPIVVLIALGSSVLEAPRAKRSFAALAVYCCLIQALGVYFYPKGHWDRLPVSVDQAPARLWNWKDNPVGRTVAAGPVWEPYAISWAALTGGTAAAARKMHDLDIKPY